MKKSKLVSDRHGMDERDEIVDVHRAGNTSIRTGTYPAQPQYVLIFRGPSWVWGEGGGKWSKWSNGTSRGEPLGCQWEWKESNGAKIAPGRGTMGTQARLLFSLAAAYFPSPFFLCTTVCSLHYQYLDDYE